jgi:phosphate-selective porin
MMPAARRQPPKAVLAGAAVAALLAAGLAPGCRAKTEREMIAAVLDDMAAQVEKKDADGLTGHLAEDYRDFEGRDRGQTAAMAESYFKRYHGIVAKVLTSRIEMGEDGTAAVETDVSLYSGVAAAFRKAVGFSGENYRVSCVFRKNGSWRISEARWETVPLDGLFPESLKILRELFPNL